MAAEVMLRRYGLRGFGGFGAASDRKLNPAPNGDTLAQILSNYPEHTIVEAVAWAGHRNCDAFSAQCQPESSGADSMRKFKESAATLASAKKGDPSSIAVVEDSMAYYAAAGYLAKGKPSGTPPAPDWASVSSAPSAADYAKKAQDELARLLNAGSNPQTTVVESSSPEAGFFAQLPVLPIAIAGTALLGLLLYVRSRRKAGRGLGHSGRTDRRGGHRMYRNGKYVGYHTHRRGRR